jgi:hypothetical protein
MGALGNPRSQTRDGGNRHPENAKAADLDWTGGLNVCGRARYGMRMTVRIWNVELFART